MVSAEGARELKKSGKEVAKRMVMAVTAGSISPWILNSSVIEMVALHMRKETDNIYTKSNQNPRTRLSS